MKNSSNENTMSREADDISAEAVVRLWTITSRITRSLDLTLGTLHGVGFTEFMILGKLVEAPNQLMRRIDLATSVGLSASGVTRILKPMEKIGLVSKESSPRDARVSLVKLTKAGKRIYTEASDSFNKQSESKLSNLDEDELHALIKLMTSLAS